MTGVQITTPVYAGFRTRALTVSGDGPELVLLHGFADCSETWSGVLAEVAKTGRAAVAVDLPGFGEADPVDGDQPMMPQLDRFVQALVAERAGRGPIVLVGNSLGACVALRVAGAGAPCAGVLTIAEPTFGDNWLNRQFKAARPTLLVRLLATPLPLPRPVSAWLMGTSVRIVVFAKVRESDRVAARRFADFFASQGGHTWVIRTARRLTRELETGHDLDRLDCPVLVVHGAKDRIIPVSASEHLHARIPGSILEVRKSWGHCPQLDDPRAVAELLSTFSDGVSVRATG